MAAFNVEKRALTEQEEDIEQSLDRLDREINRFLGQQTANNTQRNALRRQRDEEATSIQRRLRDLVNHHLSALNTAEAKMSHAMSLQPSLDVYSKPCTCACACACRNVFLCTCGRPCFCITHTVWFEVSLAGRPLGRLELALLGRTAPRTVENFFRRVVQPSSSAESYRAHRSTGSKRTAGSLAASCCARLWTGFRCRLSTVAIWSGSLPGCATMAPAGCTPGATPASGSC